MDILDRPTDRNLFDRVVNPVEFVEPKIIVMVAPVPFDVIRIDSRSAQVETWDRRAKDKNAASEQDISQPFSSSRDISAQSTSHHGCQSDHSDYPELGRINGCCSCLLPFHATQRGQ